MDNPDIELEIILEEKGSNETLKMHYKANNREPDNHPAIEFQEIWHALCQAMSDTNENKEESK